MSTLCLSYVALICTANTRIPTYSYGSLHTDLQPSTPHAFTRSTLLGCTALLRFSIHLSLSADERQEKHLLPEEVVTLCGERKRKRYDKTRMKNKKPIYKYHLCSLKKPLPVVGDERICDGGNYPKDQRKFLNSDASDDVNCSINY